MSPLLCTCHCHSATAALSPLPRRRSVAVVVVLGLLLHCHLTVIIVAVGSGCRQSRVGSSPVRVIATSSPGRGRSVTRSRSGHRYVVTRSCRGRVVTSQGRVVAMLGPRCYESTTRCARLERHRFSGVLSLAFSQRGQSTGGSEQRS
jgi:hypothetical protein